MNYRPVSCCKVSKKSKLQRNPFLKEKIHLKKIHYNVSCSHLYLNTIMATIEKETIKSIAFLVHSFLSSQQCNF